MIVEVLGLVAYEVSTFAAGWFGLKLLSGKSLAKSMAGIQQTKTIPVIGGMLKNKIGAQTKREMYLSNKAVKALRAATQYQEFRLLLVLLTRKISEHIKKGKLGSISDSIGCSRRAHCDG